MLKLEQLGTRICIIGCSSTGKSTLAKSLSEKMHIPFYHLDLWAHYPYTEWVRRPDKELTEQQLQILQQDSWIIEGNYSLCMHERFARATSVIWLDFHPVMAALQYIKRSIPNDRYRIGRLEGSRKELKWSLLKHILFNYPKNRLKYARLIKQYHLPVVQLKSMKQLKHYYHVLGL